MQFKSSFHARRPRREEAAARPDVVAATPVSRSVVVGLSPLRTPRPQQHSIPLVESARPHSLVDLLHTMQRERSDPTPSVHRAMQLSHMVLRAPRAHRAASPVDFARLATPPRNASPAIRNLSPL